MKKYRTILGFLSAMTVAGAASATDCDSSSCVSVAITRIMAESNGDVSYQVDGDTVGLACTDDRHGSLTLRANHPNFDTISELALNSFLTSKRVWFRMDTTICDISYLVLDL